MCRCTRRSAMVMIAAASLAVATRAKAAVKPAAASEHQEFIAAAFRMKDEAVALRRPALRRRGRERRSHRRLRSEPRCPEKGCERPRRARGDPRRAGAARHRRSLGMRAVFDLATVRGLRARGRASEHRAHGPRRGCDRRRPAAMIDHVSIAVRDLDQAARFYQAVLGAIGYEKLEVRAAHRRLRQDVSRILDQSACDHGAGCWLIAAPMWGCGCEQPIWSMRSMPRRSRPAAAATASRDCDRSTARAIMPPSSAIPTATASKR